jgi:hypothetical protein
MSDSISIDKGLREVRKGDPPQAQGDTTPRWRRWWLLDGKRDNGSEVADAIKSTVDLMKANQRARLDQAVVSARLYGNAPINMLGNGVTAPIGPVASARSTQKDNWIQSIIDTSTATIGENKPRPYFLSGGGDYKLQRQAKKLNQFSDGIFYEQKAYEAGGEVQRDCEIFGDGWLYVGVEFGRIVFHRVLSVELWCDDMEGALAMPRQLHWERAIDRERLIALFPKKAGLIARASRADPKEYGIGMDSTSDMVVLRRSWHLRAGPNEVDQHEKPIQTGMCVASIEHVMLTEPEECAWDEDWYPFAKWTWTPQTGGFWGQGLAEQLQSQQISYNALNASIQRSRHRQGSYKLLVEAGSKIVDEHLSNEIGAIVKYRGTPPQYITPAAVHESDYARLDSVKNGMFELAGISRLTATGEKPSGLNSGEAQRVYRDSVAQRMKTQERLNERGYMDLARISIATARQIAKSTGKAYEVRSPLGRSLRKLSLTAEELDPTDWRLQCFPTSSLPKDPAGRFAAIQERIQAGFLSMSEGKRLMDYPDLEAHETLANAAEDVLTQTLDDIVDGVRYRPPEPTDNLARAKELAVQYINFGRLHNLGPAEMEDLQTWNAQVDALMQMAMAPAGAPMGGPGAPAPGGGPPQAQPMAPPPSNMLPFAA